MDIFILLWLCTMLTFSALGVGFMSYHLQQAPSFFEAMFDVTRERQRRFRSFMASWVWLMFGLWTIASFQA